MAPIPPLGFPTNIVISGIAAGRAGAGAGGNIIHATGDLVVKVVGDAFGVFSVSSLQVRELVRDPDSGSRPVWETVATANNAGPIGVESGQALVVFVAFSCPLVPPQTTFTASVQGVVNGIPVVEVPLTGTVDAGRLDISCTTSTPLQLLAGDSAECDFSLNSTLLIEVRGVFTCDPAPGDDSPFRSSSPFQIIRQGGQAALVLQVSCPDTTAPGDYSVSFGLKDNNEANFLFSIRIPVTVISPFVVSQIIRPNTIFELRCSVNNDLFLGGRARPLSRGGYKFSVSLVRKVPNLTDETSWLALNAGSFKLRFTCFEDTFLQGDPIGIVGKDQADSSTIWNVEDVPGVDIREGQVRLYWGNPPRYLSGNADVTLTLEDQSKPGTIWEVVPMPTESGFPPPAHGDV
jgi:hypothetical protein